MGVNFYKTALIRRTVLGIRWLDRDGGPNLLGDGEPPGLVTREMKQAFKRTARSLPGVEGLAEHLLYQRLGDAGDRNFDLWRENRKSEDRVRQDRESHGQSFSLGSKKDAVAGKDVFVQGRRAWR